MLLLLLFKPYIYFSKLGNLKLFSTIRTSLISPFPIVVISFTISKIFGNISPSCTINYDQKDILTESGIIAIELCAI